MIRIYFLFVLFLVSTQKVYAGISEKWADFKQDLIRIYLPSEQSTIDALWKESVEHEQVYVTNSAYIRKSGAERIVTHYFLSKTIQEKNLTHIAIAEKKLVLRNSKTNEPYLLEEIRNVLNNEAFLQREFLSTFEHYAKEKLPANERVKSEHSDFTNINLTVIAKRVSFSRDYSTFMVTHWQELRDLVLETPFDLGLRVSNFNFGLTSTNNLVIFDTEPGAFNDGRNGMYSFAANIAWQKGQEAVLKIVNQDIAGWLQSMQQEAEELRLKKEQEKERIKKEEKLRKMEDLKKRIAEKNITAPPVTTQNSLADLVDYLEEGDCVALLSNGVYSVYYRKEQAQDPSQIRIIIIDVNGTDLAHPTEWPWYIDNYFNGEFDNGFSKIFSNYLSEFGIKNGNVFLMRVPNL